MEKDSQCFCFTSMAEKLKEVLIKQKGRDLDFKQIDNVLSSIQGNDNEKKSVLDQAARDSIKQLLIKENQYHDKPEKDELTVKNTKLKDFVCLIISLSRKKYCTNNLPIMLLSEVLETLTLKEAEEMFSFVEENVSIWTSEPFFSSGKNHLLRMCNDILRRLSKSQNTIFCGRIQLFLAQLFPLEEKSALNLNSNFDIENITYYRKNADQSSIPTVQGDTSNTNSQDSEDFIASPIDYNLYLKFWSLQDFFRDPPKCYTNIGWEKMKKSITEVLNVFLSQKLDCSMKKKKVDEKSKPAEAVDLTKEKADKLENYFAKYLTNEKLLNLQINDSNFRRYFLVQVLILNQYLLGVVKFKGPNQILSENQIKWINTTTEDIHNLIAETPPNGKQFLSAVKHMLKREENWINWKNDGCPSFARFGGKVETQKERKAKKRSIGEEYLSNKNKRINMGTAELTRLWNLNPDNLEACKQEKRLQFLPTLENFFEEAIEQADPEAAIEEEYKLVNEPNFQWKALRLLARRSHHFFVPSSAPFKMLPEYLSSVISNISEDVKKTIEMKTEIKEESDETYVTTSQIGET